MSLCIELHKDHDLRCKSFAKKYYQQIVLVNKSDVEYQLILADENTHKISFTLKDGATGYLYAGNENGSTYKGSFSRIESQGITEYAHQVQVPVMGVDEEAKLVLKQLEGKGYFAATQYMDGTIEIWGWEYGLKPNNYTFDAQSTGGSVIPLIGKYDEPEMPYVYESQTPGNENTDFNNLFSQNDPLELASFNNDFDEDFDTV